MIRYEESTEMYQHMSIIEQEKRGFVDLIDMKKRLHVEIKDYKLEAEQKRIEETLQRQKGGRKGDASAVTAAQVSEQALVEREFKDIMIVDTREFSCTTPIFLAEKNFWLVPMVLTVGDYILTDKICVERKSATTGDLFESFKSGRLLQQMENMSRYFERPILLIEFDENTEFRLYDPYL